MTAPDRFPGIARQTEPTPFRLPGADPAGEQARDSRLARFIAQRLAHVQANGCAEEKRLAAGVSVVFTEWDAKRKLAALSGNHFFIAQISALGWVLRCFAYAAWQGTPGWDPAFHPECVGSEPTLERPS